MKKDIDTKKTSKEESTNLTEYHLSLKKREVALTNIIIIISDMERDIGMVSEEIIFDGLMEQYGIGKEDATKLINVLHNRFTIYSPKSGYYKINHYP